MVSRRITKVKIILKQNLYAFFIVLIWFGLNFLYFLSTTGNIGEAFKIVFFFIEGPGEYGFFYDNFTEFIIFGLVFSLITVELFRKYNPEVTSREISKKMSNHAIIIGYNNIGKRLSGYFKEQGIPHVIIENDMELIEDLILTEDPVINDDALNIHTLLDAGIKTAKAVFVMVDDLEVQMVVNYHIRNLNSNCLLVDRIFQDDIGELISNTYKTHIISTSRYAARILRDKISKFNYEKVILVGMNHITNRLMDKLSKLNINFKVIEEEEEKIEDQSIELDDPRLIVGDPKELSVMERAEVRKADCVVILINDVTNSVLITKRIREFNPTCKLISRVFVDSVAEMLEKPPFKCEVISSSKATLKRLKQKDLLNF